MARRLNTYVHAHKDGISHAFGPGDDVPKWAQKQITNPAVWEEETTTGEAPGGTTQGAPGDGDTPPAGEGSGDGEGSGSGDGDGDELTPPPLRGPGSSTAAWAEYAAAKGFEVDSDAKASEIVEALAEAGIRIE